MNSAMFRFYGTLTVALRDDGAVSDASDEESARADVEALSSYNARLTIIAGPLLVAAGVAVLKLGSWLRLDRVDVVGPVVGWIGLLSTFAGLAATVTFIINRRERCRAKKASWKPDGSEQI
jgi:hypothetical protein